MISFTIPAYNAQEFIEEAVNSILVQELDSFEIVIVNDGSSDNTTQVCHELIKINHNVSFTYLEHKKNLGPSITHNTCVKHSKGDYIYNLDADNILPPGLIDQLLSAAEEKYHKTGKHFMISPEYAQFFYDKKFSIFGFKLPFNQRIIDQRLHFNKLDYNYIMTRPRTPATGGNYLYHKSIFQKSGGYYPKGGCYDNWCFAVACYIAGYRYITVPGTYYLHRLHDESYWVQSTQKNQEKIDLYNLIHHFKKYYSPDTLNKLKPSNLPYPINPYQYIKLSKTI